MTAKAQIAFLLNPAPAAAALAPIASMREQHSRCHSFHPYARAPRSPVIVATTRDARSPIASGTLFSSPLMLLGACIAPLEKVATTRRSKCCNDSNTASAMAVTTPVFAALSDASSSCGSSASEHEDNDDDQDDQDHDDCDGATESYEHNDSVDTDDLSTNASATSSTKPAGKSARKTRTPPCQVAGCTNIAVSRGCCVRHGGGSRCTVAGCTNRAKLYKRCFQHGGFKTCSTDGCTKKAKRYGHCWSHGGGRICEVPDCTKVSTQGGLCWAHGGGNRCKLEGCSRRSYQKYGYYCIDHAELHVSTQQQQQEQHARV